MVSPVRSLPFLEAGFSVEETGAGRRWDRSVARRENVLLRWEESLAYVLRAVNAICALQVEEILILTHFLWWLGYRWRKEESSGCAEGDVFICRLVICSCFSLTDMSISK